MSLMKRSVYAKLGAVVVALLIPAGAALFVPSRTVIQVEATPTPIRVVKRWKSKKKSKKMPNVPQGGNATFPNTFSGSGGFDDTWSITKSGAVAAGALGGSNNGWTVSFSAGNFTVTAPSGATIDTGYTVSCVTGGGYYEATFDVVAASPAATPSHNPRRRYWQQQRAG